MARRLAISQRALLGWSTSSLVCLGLATSCIDERGLQTNKVILLPSDGGESGAGSEGVSGEGGEGSGGMTGKAGGPYAVGGTGGHSGAGDAGSDGTPEGGTGASCGCPGAAGMPPLDTRCPDLDGNGVLDCDETLVKNPSFDEDANGWTKESGSLLAWAKKDGQDHDDSGSMGVTNQVVETMEGNTLNGARQCFPVSGATVYTFAVQISIPDYAGETKAGMQLNLFDNVACAGEVLDNPTTNWVKGSPWNVAQLTYLTPAKTKSAMLRLVAMKPFRQEPVAVLFDNVLGRTE